MPGLINLNMLKVQNLSVGVAGKRVLNGVNLEIPEGETHILFGPNGSGKTSLIKTILGFPDFQMISGRIEFEGIDITSMSTDERVKLGIGVAFQTSPAIRGVKLGEILRRLSGGKINEVEMAKAVNLQDEFLNRDLNLGFSGGEIKRSEVLQVLVQQPRFAMFDEPDSGVDVENLEILGKAINEFLKKRSGLLVTHLGFILRYVEADRAHVLINGRIGCSGDPARILAQILKEGYGWCETCPWRVN